MKDFFSRMYCPFLLDIIKEGLSQSLWYEIDHILVASIFSYFTTWQLCFFSAESDMVEISFYLLNGPCKAGQFVHSLDKKGSDTCY